MRIDLLLIDQLIEQAKKKAPEGAFLWCQDA
jgi:hypothetical protein